MSAYIVAQLQVTDPETFEAYRAEVPEVIESFGGRYLIRGGEPEMVEGAWTAPRLVVIQFDSLEAARRFYHSPAYQKILPLRLKAAEGCVAIVPGVDES